MITNIASWDRKLSNLAQFVRGKYNREKKLNSLGLELYKVGIKYQSDLLSEEQLNEYRNFLLEAHAGSVSYNSDFSYNDNIVNFEWSRIRKENFDSNYLIKFNDHLYDAWGEDRANFIDNSFLLDLKTGINRKTIIKKAISRKSDFRFTRDLSKYGVLVFTKPIDSQSKNFKIALSIDESQLKRPAGVSDDYLCSFGIKIELYEKSENKNHIRHFMIGFDILFPLAEGIAFRSYRLVKTNEDIVALIEIYLSLYHSIETELIEAISLDVKK